MSDILTDQAQSPRPRRTARDIPVLPDLAGKMPVDLLVNENCDVYLLHGSVLAEPVKWAEYDIDDRRVTLVYLSGKQQGLGITVPDEMQDYMQDGKLLTLLHVQDDAIKDYGMVPLIVRRYGLI